jgi:hypothetical protein
MNSKGKNVLVLRVLAMNWCLKLLKSSLQEEVNHDFATLIVSL